MFTGPVCPGCPRPERDRDGSPPEDGLEAGGGVGQEQRGLSGTACPGLQDRQARYGRQITLNGEIFNFFINYTLIKLCIFVYTIL